MIRDRFRHEGGEVVTGFHRVWIGQVELGQQFLVGFFGIQNLLLSQRLFFSGLPGRCFLGLNAGTTAFPE